MKLGKDVESRQEAVLDVNKGLEVGMSQKVLGAVTKLGLLLGREKIRKANQTHYQGP